MGTRADFYIGRGKNAKWLGSIAWDGHPDSINPHSKETEEPYHGYIRHKSEEWPAGEHLFDSKTEDQFKQRLTRFFQYRDDVTLPEQGWPWPWENSNTTDYAYAYDEGKVYGTCFGHGWWIAPEEPDEENDSPKDIEWPNMDTSSSAPAGDNRSGVMMITV